MDVGEDDVGYPPNSYGVGDRQGLGSSQHQKVPVGNTLYSQSVENNYPHDEEDAEDGAGGEDEENDGNGVNAIGKDSCDDGDGDADGNEEEDEDDDDDDDDDEDDDDSDDYGGQNDGGDNKAAADADGERHPKKRKLKTLISSYEFVPRVPVPSATSIATATTDVSVAAVRVPSGGRNTLADWTEHETFVLLDAWGDRFLKLGRKSLRSEEWHEVADKVSQESKMERTDTQCRNRLDTLKKKYKKEKMKLAGAGGGGGRSKWVYFKKMDMLMSSPPRQAGLSCGMDSGEYVFTKPGVYLKRTNGLDEMKDSPGNSESSKGVEEESDGPPAKRKNNGGKSREGSSFKLLADSIQKFSEIYEKIERNKKQQMAELQKIRMEFQRDLEVQRRQILERAKAEIAKITSSDAENNVSS